MAEKVFVIDTNVLLHDPEAYAKFARHDVFVPVTVLEELDKMKRLPSELGKNARTVFRFLDSLKKSHPGNLHAGVKMENGATLKILLDEKPDGPLPFPLNINDNKIIWACAVLQKKGYRVVFVSKDFAARIKAEAIGIEAEDYENLKYSYEGIYRGIRYIDVEKSTIDHFYKDGAIPLPGIEAKANEYFVLHAPENASAVGKYDPRVNGLVALLKPQPLWGIKPRNVEQKCAVDLLMRDEIKLITLLGTAGTGKTLLALASGLRKVFDEATYSRILVSRPVVPLGRDIGYLPGTKEEKLFHWMQAIYDNLEFLCDSTGHETSETLRFVLDSKKVEMEAVTYIRGRSLPKMFIIVDEAQNLTPHEIKTIVSRAGEGTKVILTGDPTQIDNPYLDENSNGLTYLVNRFAGDPIYGTMRLDKTERSHLAALAAQLL